VQICKLKSGKNYVYLGLSLDYFMNAGTDLSAHIVFLFLSLLFHGIIPHDMQLSTVTPIPKGKTANLSTSANYRGIALGSMFANFFTLLS
jgi:hypothetical protein